MKFSEKFWAKIALLNFLIIALIGLLMRYKIGFEFPYFDQKRLQHGHSHFAFAGWVSMLLMALIASYLKSTLTEKRIKHYQIILFANLISAYGMLITFPIQGYGLYSITFSTISLGVTYIFSIYAINDLKKINSNPASQWFISALWFNVISTLGTFVLIYMMATKQIIQTIYLSSVYFYLHFQYNGWFFFASFGLLIHHLHSSNLLTGYSKSIYKLFFYACIPMYILSILWAKLPYWIIGIGMTASIIQLVAWFKFLQFCKEKFKEIYNGNFLVLSLLSIIAIAVSIKLMLQAGSTIPSISQMAFGFRPIVIAYLHLIFLVQISIFLLFYMLKTKLLCYNIITVYGIYILIIGIMLNEFALAFQGILSISYTVIPYIDMVLIACSITIVLGIIVLICSQLFNFEKKEMN